MRSGKERDKSGTTGWSQWGRTLALIVACGIFLCAFSFRLVRGHEIQSSREEFELQASTSEYAVRREIGSNLAALKSLRSFIALTPHLKESEFTAFAEEEIHNNQSILSLEWAPVVSNAERPAFERELKRRGSAHPFIRSSLSTNPQPAAQSESYCPVEFITPNTEAERAVGFNRVNSAISAKLLEKAAATGQLAAGGKVAVAELSGDKFAIPAVMAVFDGVPVHRGAPPRRQRIKGYVSGLFQMEVVLGKGLYRLPNEPIDFEFYDLSAAPGQRFLFRRAGNSGGVAAAKRLYPAEEAALAAGDFRKIAKFQVGGRQWAMVITATGDYLRLRRTWLSWSIVGIILAVTGVVSALFVIHVRHALRDEELRHLRSRRETEDALRVSEERYALAARGSKDGLWDWDLSTGLIYYSERWKSMLGFESGRIGNSPDEWISRLYPADRDRVADEISRHCRGESEHFQSEYRILHRDGSYRWMISRGVAVLNEQGIATRLAGSQTDITENKAADPLTGLASRLLLHDRLQLSIDQARMDPRDQFALLFLDLDRFKLVNDSLGHRAGDRLLLGIAHRLLMCAAEPPFDAARTLVARLGGDEFVLLICGRDAAALGGMLADRIQEALQPAFDLDGIHTFVSASIGVRVGHPNATPETLLLDADTAMYHAKSQGKQRNEVFEPAMRFRAVERLRLETDLRNAIQARDLTVSYQPKVCIATGVVSELEALVRWKHPDRGVVGPVDFIPVAEETGLIIQLGTFVLRTACRQMAAWLREFEIEPATRVSVNLSCRQFRHPDLFGEIMGILAETGLPPERLSLEITEGVLMEDMESAVAILKRLRAQNIGLQIDDFGTGYSSLSYLRRLPFDCLKIDRSFVKEIGQGIENDEIVSTIALLGRTLGMSVVAEGVETLSQLQMLTEAGCEYAQGFLYSEAVDGAEARRFFSGFGRLLSAPAGHRPERNRDLIAG